MAQRKKISPIAITAIICLAVFVTSGEIFGLLGLLSYAEKQDAIKTQQEQINKYNLTRDASEFVAYVDTFYNYNISNAGKKLTLKELQAEGGVCEHYAKLYRVLGELNGLYADTLTINITNDTRHMIAIISNEEGWCVLSNNDYTCWV